MQLAAETPKSARIRFFFVCLIFALLMALAHGGAQLLAYLGAPHAVTYYRVVFTIWVATGLLTIALCFHLFQRRGGPQMYWLAFWTFAYLAFLVHILWAVGGLFHWDFAAVFNSHEGVATDPEKVVDNPGPDLFLAAWWGLDVLLAWVLVTDHWSVHVQRGAVHLLAFVMFFGATVLAAKVTLWARFFGVVMTASVLFCFLLRLVVRESDPKSPLTLLYVRTFQFLNLFLRWDQLPTFLAIANLGALREVLRANNLHDTSGLPVTNRGGQRPDVPFRTEYQFERERDGYWNDLAKPDMGSASLNPNDPTDSSEFTLSSPGARFGRNISLSEVDPTRDASLLDPNPRLVSNLLLAREKMVKAPTLNLLAAAWIQFQTHDWFNHGNPVKGGEIEVPIDAGDAWHEKPMRVRRTRPDPTRTDGDGSGPATYANAESHWWDASQVYGCSTQASAVYRLGTDGKLKVGPDRLVPADPARVEQTGLTSNWWVGLSLLHNLFALEHNAICDRLRQAYPAWGDDELYRKARLANTALMAKIHTVDWTPAILGHPALQIGMNANWWGLATERVKKLLGRISTSEAVSGIPGSEVNQHGADFCLTEEFVAVYRLHPLLPDTIELRSAADDRLLHELVLGAEQERDDDVVGPHARANALRYGTMADLVYSFGVESPGAVVLHNFPNWMRRLKRRKGAAVDELIDLAALDILRDRERGVPRYNRFRRLFHLPPVRSFEQLTPNRAWAEELRKVYGHVDKVDLMVGMYAEEFPEGFGFSDTAFRVFILMASRRLKSDRFFTTDYTPEVYSPEGLAWVEDNNMTTVLLRHYPELTAALQHAPNPFAPWKRVGSTAVPGATP